MHACLLRKWKRKFSYIFLQFYGGNEKADPHFWFRNFSKNTVSFYQTIFPVPERIKEIPIGYSNGSRHSVYMGNFEKIWVFVWRYANFLYLFLLARWFGSTFYWLLLQKGQTFVHKISLNRTPKVRYGWCHWVQFWAQYRFAKGHSEPLLVVGNWIIGMRL